MATVTPSRDTAILNSYLAEFIFPEPEHAGSLIDRLHRAARTGKPAMAGLALDHAAFDELRWRVDQAAKYVVALESHLDRRDLLRMPVRYSLGALEGENLGSDSTTKFALGVEIFSSRWRVMLYRVGIFNAGTESWWGKGRVRFKPWNEASLPDKLATMHGLAPLVREFTAQAARIVDTARRENDAVKKLAEAMEGVPAL